LHKKTSECDQEQQGDATTAKHITTLHPVSPFF